MKKSILLLLVLFSAGHAYSDNKVGETKTARHTIQVSPGETINIQARNTFVQIESWDKNEVEVFAQVTFDGKANEKMRSFLDQFEKHVLDQISRAEGELFIRTNLDEPNKVQIGKYKGDYFAGVMIGYGENQLRMEYTIKVPENNKLNVKCAYKDLIMTGTYENVDIYQYSANFRANILRNARLNLKYGKATVDEMGSGYLETYENDMQVTKAESLEINDKYSDYQLGTINKIQITGYESDVEISSGESITGNLKYGTLNIKEKVSHGSLTLYEYDIIGQAMVNLRLDNSKYSKIQLDRANEIRFVESYEDELKIRYINSVITKSKYGTYEIEQVGKKFELLGYNDDVIIGEVLKSTENILVDGKYLNISLGLKNAPYALNTDIKYGKVSYDESSLDVKKYIQENENLKIEAASKSSTGTPIPIRLVGYEVKVDIL